MPKINPNCCPDLAEKISALIDNELTLEISEEVELHLVTCLDCSETYHVELTLKQRVSTTFSVNQAPSELIMKIKQEILSNQNLDE
jgi:hypothetical protein